MGVLKNSRHELFCHEYIACEFVGSNAYRNAGYEVKNAGVASSQAYKLMAREDIQERLAELLRPLVTDTKRRGEAVMSELEVIAFANIADYLEWSDSSIRIKSSSEIPKHLMAAVAELSETQTAMGSNVRLKLHNKEAALTTLAKIEQLMTSKVEISADSELKDFLRAVSNSPEGSPAGRITSS